MSKSLWIIAALVNCVLSAGFLSLQNGVLATHFDFQGHPNGFMNVRFYAGFGLAMALFSNGILIIVSRLFRNVAGLKWANIPNRDFWMATPERQELVLRKLRATLDATGVFVNGVLCASHGLIYFFNFHSAVTGPRAVNLFVGAVMLTGIGFVVYVMRIFKPN